MKERIKKYVDNLFSDIHETKQLRELKEEICANLLEKVNDYLAGGDSEDTAFKKAVSNLGDMSELVASLKKASETRSSEEMTRTKFDRTHVIGYVVASAILLFGLMTGGIVYLRGKALLNVLASFMPFLLLSAPVFLYLGLTQETRHHYGMNRKRALSYSLAAEVLLFGAVATGIVYFQGQPPFVVLSTFMPFLMVSAIVFIYLGLTEKSRRKMGSVWEKQWIDYYSNPRSAVVRGSISGALWIFSFAAFFLVAFTWGWKYSWIVFVVAIGIEVLLEAFFASKKDN